MGPHSIHLAVTCFLTLRVTREERERLTCSWSLHVIPSRCVSINQRFAINLHQQCSTSRQVIKHKPINFLLICMIIKSLTFNSGHCPRTRSLMGALPALGDRTLLTRWLCCLSTATLLCRSSRPGDECVLISPAGTDAGQQAAELCP